MGFTFIKEISAGDVIALLAFIAAVYIGIVQNRINKQLLKMQDSVDIFLRIQAEPAIGNPNHILSACIEIRNISSMPLTLVRYIFNGVDRMILPYRLPPAAQFPDAYYYINLPSVSVSDYAAFTLYFKDFKKREWSVYGYSELRNGRWEISWERPKRIRWWDGKAKS